MATITRILKAPSKIPAFQSMRNRDFRWFWFSGLGQTTGQGMLQFTLPWLVLSLPGTSLSQLGVVIALQGVPMFSLLLFGGVLADRLDRRRVLLVGQMFMVANIMALASLTVADAVEIWHVYIASAITGSVQGFTMPARGSMVRFLVERNEIMNAVALNSMLMNSSRIIGPSIAGGTIALVGIGAALYVNGALYAVGVAALLVVRVSGKQQSPTSGSAASALASGARYVLSTPLVMTLVGLNLSVGLFAMPYLQLLPAFAKEVLELGPGASGGVALVAGIGSLVGNVGLTFLGNSPHKNLFALGLLGLFTLSLMALAASGNFAIALVALFFVGLGSTTFIVVSNAMVQLTVPQEYLGRVVAFTQMGMALMFVGSLPMGIIGDALGLRVAFALGAGALLAATLLLGVAYPALRHAKV